MEPTVSWLHLFNRHCISIGGPTCHVTDEETDTVTGHQWAAACRDVAGEPSGKTEGTGRICPYRRVGAPVSCAAQARGDVETPRREECTCSRVGYVKTLYQEMQLRY